MTAASPKNPISVVKKKITSTKILTQIECICFWKSIIKNQPKLIFPKEWGFWSQKLLKHLNTVLYQWYDKRVIPYESTEKNMIFFGFFTNKVKSFWYFSKKKTFFFNKIVGIFDHFYKFLNIFIFIFEVFKNEIFNIMFYFSFLSQKCLTFCHRSKSLWIFTFLCF